MTKLSSFSIVFLILVLCSTGAFAQATASTSIRGSVLDSTGAAVVGADVTVFNSSTGFSRTVKTGNDGSYVVGPIPAGVYGVKVSSSGFATAAATKVETLVGSATTQNFSVKAGA